MSVITSQKTALKVAASIFLLVAIAHVLRILTIIQVVINGSVLPVWVSIVAVIVMLTLSWWMFKLSK